MTLPPYTANRFSPSRRKSIPVRIRDQVIGGSAPILVQSMTNTSTRDIGATSEQVLNLARAGCGLVRITVPSVKDAECLKQIIAKVRAENCEVPISADIHFQPQAAFEALKWADKVRINPGNFADPKPDGRREFSSKEFEQGVQTVHDVFGPFVREAKKQGVCLRIGINHGSLSDRMMQRYGDTVEGMVESALEYLRVCEEENYDQIVFSMKASHPAVVIQSCRLLASKLSAEHKNYPFHLGVTEAGEGEDGRLRSAAGIGPLLLDGIGDTIRVSLTEDPVREIPVAQEIIRSCEAILKRAPALPVIPESIDYFSYRRRPSNETRLGPRTIGGRETIPVGAEEPDANADYGESRPLEWYTTMRREKYIQNLPSSYQLSGTGSENCGHDFVSIISSQLLDNKGPLPEYLEVVVDDISHMDRLEPEQWKVKNLFWSVLPEGNVVGKYRYLTAWLNARKRSDPIILIGITTGSEAGELRTAAQLGSILSDGIGDLMYITGTLDTPRMLNLGYGILQAAGVRRTKAEFISCPGCGRTLFELEQVTRTIKELTGHLNDVSIAVMGCIVNGPGEMADADFGYVGGAPGKVNLYVGRKAVKKGLSEKKAPEALVELIKEQGRWRDP